MKFTILKTVFSFFLFAVLFVACEDDPSSLGLDSIPDSDKLGISTITSLEVPMEQKHSFYNAGLTDSTWNLGTSIRIIVGKNSYVTSSMLIRFRSNVADSIIEYFDESNLSVIEAWVELKPAYTLGDENSSLTLNVSKITADWTSSLFTQDTLEEKVKPNTTYINTIATNDSLIKFDITSEMATDWLVSSIKDSTELNYGLLFEPTEGSNKFYGFYSLHEENIVNGYDNIPVAKIVVKKGESDLDTLNFYSLRDVHALKGEIPANTGEYIYLQGGYPLRANYYIDVSSIPENSIIVDAVLDFYYDKDLTFDGSASSNRINTIMYSDSTNKQLLTGTNIHALARDSVENKYSGDVTSFIQRWNQGTENQGLFVYLPNESYTLNRIAVYGSKYSEPLLRPKLTIRYTKR